MWNREVEKSNNNVVKTVQQAIKNIEFYIGKLDKQTIENPEDKKLQNDSLKTMKTQMGKLEKILQTIS